MGILDRFRKASRVGEDLPWPRLKARAMESLRAQTAAHDSTWGLGAADWAVDMEAGTITFAGPDVVATAPVQVVGTLAADGSWLWGWDHPSVPAGLDEHAAEVRAYGRRHGIDALTTRTLSASEEEAWEYTAVAALLGEAQGAYRGPSGDTAVFLTFGSVSLTRSSDAPDRLAPAPHAPVVPTPGNPSPELVGPPEGIPTPATSPHLAGPEPEVSADALIAFVQGYFREMHPTYHKAAGAEIDWDTQDRLWAEQDEIRARHWRRDDTYFEGPVSSNDRRYDLDVIRDWTAQRIAPRLWQVNWVKDDTSQTTSCGLLMMAFDDGPRIVDEIFDKQG